MELLKSKLLSIDGQGYKAYKSLQGEYIFESYVLTIDHVQGDPFADPSRCRLFFNAETLELPASLYLSAIHRVALEDFLGRRVADAIEFHGGRVQGSGNSGEIRIAQYGQQVLRRNALLVKNGAVELRCQLGLPANGRRVAAGQAIKLLCEVVPSVVEKSLLSIAHVHNEMKQHVQSVVDQQYLREQLVQNHLVAFVADGSILPRASGIDDAPLKEAICCKAPESICCELQLQDGSSVRGLAIPAGVSLIVGGGFHGKSTLLHALERGVYNHIPGDGRERVVTDSSAVKIRAEDGRSIRKVDISPFIGDLPQGRSTRDFSTDNASGSTSQAASIIEALATSTSCLLIDEDTSATNFMIRDRRMRALVGDSKEPITPLVQRIATLYQQHAVSVVLVMGGSGDYFASADTVLMMDNYLPVDVTEKAWQLANKNAYRSAGEGPHIMAAAQTLRIVESGIDARMKTGKEKIQAFDTRILRFGQQEIDLGRVEQLVDSGQLISIGYLLKTFAIEQPEEGDLVAGLARLLQQIERTGLDCLTPHVMGTLAMPRLQELLATVNRLRSLRIG